MHFICIGTILIYAMALFIAYKVNIKRKKQKYLGGKEWFVQKHKQKQNLKN